MELYETVEIAQKWQDAINEKNIEKLVEYTDKDIEIDGPKGSGFGQQLLIDWVNRAGISLITIQKYGRGDTVVLHQLGVWRNNEGAIIGEAHVASVMKVNDKKVKYISRYDDLGEALEIGSLNDQDFIEA